MSRFRGLFSSILPLVLLPIMMVLLLSAARLAADEPLAPRIDALIAAKMNGPASPRADDAQFLRRVYLDLAGRTPSVEEARAFLADSSADKRAKLVDHLLASSDYVNRMSDLLHVMLMERQGDTPEWRKFLRSSFEANKPWDQMVREMIWADPADEKSQGAAFFFTKRLENYGQNPVDVPGMVRDVGRLFLGMDVQCAQCHDHLFVDQYKQDYYQGLFAFVGQTFIRKDVKFPAIGESPLKKKVEFVSVFVKEPRAIGPKLPDGEEVAIPEFKAGEEYVMAPDRKTNFPGVLKFSPMRVLSEQLPRSENAPFARNAANRFWWIMMGRGLVHPLDLQHAENPPSHPELLELLAFEFGAHRFDIKWLLKELALTETYQRSSAAPAGVAPDSVPPESYRMAIEKPLSAEQMLGALLHATGEAPRLATNETELTKLRDRFTKSLANPPKEPEVEFSPSVRAALFLSNDEVILSWTQPRAGNLVERLVAMSEPEKLVDELYLAVLTRQPTDEERTDAVALLKKHADRRAAVAGQLVWALCSSTEFAINH